MLGWKRLGGFAPLAPLVFVAALSFTVCAGKSVVEALDNNNGTNTISPVRPSPSALTTYYYDSGTASYVTEAGSVESVTREHPTYTPAVQVFYHKGVHEVGWDTLYVEIVPSYLTINPAQAYYAAGWVEGFETHHRIWEAFNNLYPPEDPLEDQASSNVQAFVQAQLAWTSNEAAARVANNNSQTPFWSAVQNIQSQLQGLADGYQHVNPAGDDHYLSDFQIFLVNYAFELTDLRAHFNETDPAGSPVRLQRSDSAALIKHTSNDLLVGHATWSSYRSMLRQYKVYAFERIVAMSSYPGTVHSGDNWYMMDSGLTTVATTFTDFYATAYGHVMPNSVPAFIRMMSANRVARSGKEWTKLFCTANSGTMNGQFMVVDFTLFNASGVTATERLPGSILNVAEQLPGSCRAEDASALLRDDSYWASFGRPAMPQTQMISGFSAMELRYGAFFSYDNYSLALILKRNQSAVTDWGKLIELLRYNGYTYDEFSSIPNCSTCPNATCSPARSPWLAVASRGDLAPVGGNSTLGPLYEFLSRSPRGAIDAKVAAWSEHMRLGAHIVSGPASDPANGIPPFQWSESPFSMTLLGMPDLFDFEVQNTTDLLSFVPFVEQPEPPHWWILGVAGGALLAAIVAAIIYKRWQLSREGEDDTLLP